MDADPQQVGLELYARGYFNTRKEAIGLARSYPDKAAALLAPHRKGDEMGHADDRAHIDGPDGYGPANTGQGKP